MRKVYLYLSVVGVFLLSPVLSKAQFISSYKDQGDTYFSQEKYYAASVYYQKALSLLPDDVYYYPYLVRSPRTNSEKKDANAYQSLVYKLGQSFRLYKDYKSAEEWYVKTMKFKTDDFPLAQLWYGVCLRADENYQAALKELKSFKSNYSKNDKYSRRAQLEIASCEFAIRELKYPQLAEVKELSSPLNVENGSDYAPMLKGDTLFFSSSRALENVNSKKHDPYINKIYFTSFNSSTPTATPKIKELIKDKFTDVAVSSIAGNYLYFTVLRSENKGAKQHYVIMVSEEDENGNYQKAGLLPAPVNLSDYDTKEAFVTADGSYLVFSSNRPGGKGGYDLWYSKLDEKGKPTGEAINLGSEVNTMEDELNPYYDDEKRILVFSSDGRVGMGGLDLFKTKGSFASNDWSSPQNLGYPLNSAKDDAYYYPSKEHSFLTSSDRNSICCFDLYEITKKHLRLVGHVYDKKTHEPINDVETVLMDSITGKPIGTITTAANGFFHFSLNDRRPLKMHFSHEKYGIKDTVITNAALKMVDTLYEMDVYLTLSVPGINEHIKIKNIYYDFDKATLRPESKPALDSIMQILQKHQGWVVEIGSHTDGLGSDEYNAWLSQQRAQSVVDYLISQGINEDRLIAKGYGESQPIASNKKANGKDNPKGRQLNRRTEFKIVDILRVNGNEKIDTLLESVVGDKDKIRIDYSRDKWLSKDYYQYKNSKGNVGNRTSSPKHSLEKPSQIILKNYKKVSAKKIGPIYYSFNHISLRPTSKKTLDSVVAILKSNPDLFIYIVSYTDSKGSEIYNIGLSQRRTHSCVVYLQDQGIPENRILGNFRGEKPTVAPNKKPNGSDNPQGRRLNRRTELTFLKKK